MEERNTDMVIGEVNVKLFKLLPNYNFKAFNSPAVFNCILGKYN